MKMYSRDGNEMIHIRGLWREGSSLVVKGKIMQAMNMSIYLQPEDVWKAKSLLSWNVIRYLPVIILKGWLASRKNKKEESRS